MERFANFQVFKAERKDGIFFAYVNRPQVRNAMNTQGWRELGQIINFVETDPESKILIITGVGDKAFVSGADISELNVRTGVENLYSLSRGILLSLENCRKPSIAAINGYAFGGGFEIALACDIRVCSENAQFGLPEPGIGVIPGAGGTQRLPRMIGVGRAKEVIMVGKKIRAEEAVNIGLALKVVPLANLVDEAVATAKDILAKGPVAIDIAKRCVNISMYTDLSTGLAFEQFGMAVALSSEDKKEGTSAFLEKRPPNFPGK